MLLLVSFLGITYSYEYNDAGVLSFELVGDYTVNLNLNDLYIEQGVIVYYDGKDISSRVLIDSSMVDVSKVGEYQVKYELKMNNFSEYIYRVIKVRESISPQIMLKGDEVMYVKYNGNYIEPGYEVSDNYDTDLRNKVVITNNVNVSKIGEYKVKYSVIDSSGNQTVVFRKVIVN